MNDSPQAGAPSGAFFLGVAVAVISVIVAWSLAAPPNHTPLFSLNDSALPAIGTSFATPIIVEERQDVLTVMDHFTGEHRTQLGSVDLNDDFILFASTFACTPFQRNPRLVIDEDGWAVRNVGPPDPLVICEELLIDVHAFVVDRQHRELFTGVPTS